MAVRLSAGFHLSKSLYFRCSFAACRVRQFKTSFSTSTNSAADSSPSDDALNQIVAQQYAAFAQLSQAAQANSQTASKSTQQQATTESEWVRVCDSGQLTEGKRCVIRVGKKWIAVFHHQGAFYAVDDVCAHMGFSLARGKLLPGDMIQCPGHGWKFNVRTGASEYPDVYQRTFAVEERPEGLFVDVNRVLNSDKFARKTTTTTPL